MISCPAITLRLLRAIPMWSSLCATKSVVFLSFFMLLDLRIQSHFQPVTNITYHKYPLHLSTPDSSLSLFQIGRDLAATSLALFITKIINPLKILNQGSFSHSQCPEGPPRGDLPFPRPRPQPSFSTSTPMAKGRRRLPFLRLNPWNPFCAITARRASSFGAPPPSPIAMAGLST